MEQGMYVPEAKTGAAIQAAIDLAHEEGGGVVFLPAGVYTVTGTIRLKSTVSLIGAGDQTILRMQGPSDQTRKVNIIQLVTGGAAAVHDIEVSKLAIEGPSTKLDLSEDVSDISEQGCGIIAFRENVERVVIRACRIQNASGCGIFFRTPEDHLMKEITVEDCRLLQNRRPGEDGKPDSFKDIYFNGRRFENIRVEGNVCRFAPDGTNPYGNDSGIAFVINTLNAPGFVRNVRLVGNVCSGHRRHGLITNYDTLDVDWAFVSGNRCENNGWMGIYVNTNAVRTENTRVVISGNYCQHNGFSGLGNEKDAGIRGGIVVSDAENLVIANNICMDNGAPGSDFRDDSGDLETSDKASGIRVRGKKVIIEGNLVQGNKGSGVSMWPGRVGQVSILNNRVVENSKQGIEVAGVSGDLAQQVVVTGNLCADNGGNGIRVSATDGALVASNYVSNNGGPGIELDGKTNNVSVDGNFVQPKAGQSAIKMDAVKNFRGANQPLTG